MVNHPEVITIYVKGKPSENSFKKFADLVVDLYNDQINKNKDK